MTLKIRYSLLAVFLIAGCSTPSGTTPGGNGNGQISGRFGRVWQGSMPYQDTVLFLADGIIDSETQIDHDTSIGYVTFPVTGLSAKIGYYNNNINIIYPPDWTPFEYDTSGDKTYSLSPTKDSIGFTDYHIVTEPGSDIWQGTDIFVREN